MYLIQVYTHASELARYKRSDVCRQRFTQSGDVVRHKKTPQKTLRKVMKAEPIHIGERNRMNAMFVTKDLRIQATW